MGSHQDPTLWVRRDDVTVRLLVQLTLQHNTARLAAFGEWDISLIWKGILVEWGGT